MSISFATLALCACFLTFIEREGREKERNDRRKEEGKRKSEKTGENGEELKEWLFGFK